MIKTIEQITSEGHKVVSDNDETFKTQNGMMVYVWTKISQFKVKMIEQYRLGVSL